MKIRQGETVTLCYMVSTPRQELRFQVLHWHLLLIAASMAMMEIRKSDFASNFVSSSTESLAKPRPSLS